MEINTKQYAALEKASALRSETIQATTAGRGPTRIALTVPRQGVALVLFDGR